MLVCMNVWTYFSLMHIDQLVHRYSMVLALYLQHHRPFLPYCCMIYHGLITVLFDSYEWIHGTCHQDPSIVFQYANGHSGEACWPKDGHFCVDGHCTRCIGGQPQVVTHMDSWFLLESYCQTSTYQIISMIHDICFVLLPRKICFLFEQYRITPTSSQLLKLPGMEFIHSCNVIHSDLTGRNVLLCVLSQHTRWTNGKLEKSSRSYFCSIVKIKKMLIIIYDPLHFIIHHPFHYHYFICTYYLTIYLRICLSLFVYPVVTRIFVCRSVDSSIHL